MISVERKFDILHKKFRDNLKIQHSTFEVGLLVTAEFWFNCHLSLVLFTVPYQKRIHTLSKVECRKF